MERSLVQSHVLLAAEPVDVLESGCDEGSTARREPHREHVEGRRDDRRQARSGGVDHHRGCPRWASPTCRRSSAPTSCSSARGPTGCSWSARRRSPSATSPTCPRCAGKKAACFLTFALNAGKSIDKLSTAVGQTGADVVGGLEIKRNYLDEHTDLFVRTPARRAPAHLTVARAHSGSANAASTRWSGTTS